MIRATLATAFLSAFVAAPLYADSTAPAPGVAAEAQISDADLAAEIKRLEVKPPQNGSFTAYHVTDVGADSAVPLKLALVGTDALSLSFLKKYATRLREEHYTVLLLGDDAVLQQFQTAYPGIYVERYELNNQLLLMLHMLGIRHYPALYDNGQVMP